MKFHEGRPPKDFDKYEYYFRSVQNPEDDTKFFTQAYVDIKRRLPKSLREDFCGTFAICCEWVCRNKNYTAVGVDLDPEPIAYGKANYYSQLTDDEKSRLQILNKNVLDKKLPKVDIIAALNFSYFLFKKREELKKYFANCLHTLNKNGILIIDCFGGGQCQNAIEEETKYRDFSYFWDQKNFDPITNEGQFYIHFKLPQKAKITKAFSYDWRLWSIPELRELMDEVGFKKTRVYWEGTNKQGGGNGIFTESEKGEECESWVAYIVAEK